MRNLPPKSKKPQPATPNSASDDEGTTKPKKPRQRAGTRTWRPRDITGRNTAGTTTGRDDVSSPEPASSSLRPEMKIARPSTLLTPSSSPRLSGDGTGRVTGGDDIDLNQGRRKRRKKTPVPSEAERDMGSESAMPQTSPSQQQQPAPIANPVSASSGRPLTSYNNRILTIRTARLGLAIAPAGVEQSSRPALTNALDLLGQTKKKGKGKKGSAPLQQEHSDVGIPAMSHQQVTGIATAPSSPTENLPSFPALPKAQKSRKKRLKKVDAPPLPVLTQAAEKKKKVNYDAESGILTIHSSPVITPESPPMPPVNAFSLLGKHPPPAVPAAPASVTQGAKSPPLPAVTIKEKPKITAGIETKKPVHPFFQPGGMKSVPTSSPSTAAALPGTERENSFISSVSSEHSENLKRNSYFFGPTTTNSIDVVNKSVGISFLSPTSNRALKTPGSVDAPWPPRDSCHVRGLSQDEIPDYRMGEASIRVERKLKYIPTSISPEENILDRHACELSISEQREDILSADYNERRYYDLPPDVRLPKRIVTTGSCLQETMRGRISARLPHPKTTKTDTQQSRSSSVSSGGSTERTSRGIHPALANLYNRLGKELTAFDKGECENQAWEVKYAPTSSEELLQVGKEPQILKDWLMALKVESVATGSSEKKNKGKRKSRSNSPRGGGKGPVGKKKKRKKDENELSGFIIDSAEESGEMDEITDPEDTDYSTAPGVKKSTIRSGDRGKDSPFGALKEPARLVNAVVISGPNGCGKTAAVYAVAKEAGFTVFEVSPGTRRSGKDILDLVGEMTRTHLVHQAKTNSLGDATSFFKNKQLQKVKGRDSQPTSAQQQQQSLILFEEVDLLFEEDKQFWSTVLALMAQSKRPIVMTCNDEGLLPLDALPLHAILRLAPPSLDLIVDHLLLICANEGHLLKREAVNTLVKSMNNDLRASLMELEFWCRMGVGDRRGGLDWALCRWPPGVDIGQDGEVLRVVSRNTYRNGMSWIPKGVKNEEKWRDIWEKWGVDVGDGNDKVLMESTQELGEGLEAIRVWEEYAEAMSSVDVSSGVGMNSNDVSFMILFSWPDMEE